MLFGLLSAKKRPTKLQRTNNAKGMDNGVLKENAVFLKTKSRSTTKAER
jgi:hypothetical protein